MLFKRVFFVALVLIAAGCTKKKSRDAAPSVPVVPVTKEIKNFAIYYSYPTSTNASTLLYDVNSIATFFKQYSTVVFGAGLEGPAHPDHAGSVAITALMKGQTAIYGYVSIGFTNAESTAAVKARIDRWKTLFNADGMFLDEFGFDYRIPGYTDAQVRARQKELVDYVHSLGMRVFMNSYEPDDVFVKESSNPLTFLAGDKYLYESFIFSFAARETFAFYRAKVAKLKAAKAATGVEMYAINTTAAPESAFVQADYDYMILAAAADNFDGISWGTDLFSAVTANMPYRTNLDLLKKIQGNSPVFDNSAETITFTHPNGIYRLNHATPSLTKLN